MTAVPLGQLRRECGTQDINEQCDDWNTVNGDGCNPTCNLTNTTSLFAGFAGSSL